ncbi:MAG: NADH-quinone oxidoreductase subunit M [Verrucomicrobia bacterium]|nr:NADH-quinone oxidoreductase subunit M [Verrucomicrobiota bacterium]
MTKYILTYIICCPLLAALILLFIPRNFRFVIRNLALLATAISALFALKMFFFDFTTGFPGRQLQHKVEWIGSLGINYHVAVDGLNVGLILMGAIVAFAAAAVSREINKYEKEFYVLLLVMTGGILGAFASYDLFFFYFFHELALVPTFIMIGLWGRGENKNYATFQITIYLSLGALLALVGLIALYLQLPPDSRTFNIAELTNYFSKNPMNVNAQNLIFPLLLFGFGILVSLWPFHTWAPLGYGSAPTATAMLHAGVLKKFGLYGLIRIALPLMPEAAQSWLHIIAVLCLGNIVYVGWVAMRQRDLNMLIGNSSVAHMGFCFLGIASLSLIGITGTVVVMVAHGFLAALSFALSGYIREQTNTLDMNKMSGLLRPMPFVGATLVMAAMAGCGLPGFANFAGEMMVLFGSWKGAFHTSGAAINWIVVAAVWGALVIGALYMLRAVRNILHGPVSAEFANVKDAGSRSIHGFAWWPKLPYVLLVGALLLFGFAPRLLTDKIKPSVDVLLDTAFGKPIQESATAQVAVEKP